MRLPDFEAWAIFAAVVEHRSFSAAAEALGTSKATVSKAITRLEAALHTSLFHRTSRRLTLTDSGRSLAEHAQRILAEGRHAEEIARESASAPTGLVRVAAPLTFGIAQVGPAVADFLSANEGIEIELCLSDARVDIVAEGFDIALRIANLPDSSLRARKLADIPVHIVASPGYLDRHGRPRHPAELGEHDCIAYTNVPARTWHFRGPGGEEASVRLKGRLASDNGEVTLPALHAGLGVAVLPEFIVGPDLAAGRLEAILTDWHAPGIALHLVTPPGTLRPARVEALIAFFTERFRDVCRTEDRKRAA